MANMLADQRRVQVSVTLPPRLYDALRDAAHRALVSKSEIVEAALNQFLAAHHPELTEKGP